MKLVVPLPSVVDLLEDRAAIGIDLAEAAKRLVRSARIEAVDLEIGVNKICYYDCPSGEAAITVKSYQLCPLRISR